MSQARISSIILLCCTTVDWTNINGRLIHLLQNVYVSGITEFSIENRYSLPESSSCNISVTTNLHTCFCMGFALLHSSETLLKVKLYTCGREILHLLRPKGNA